MRRICSKSIAFKPICTQSIRSIIRVRAYSIRSQTNVYFVSENMDAAFRVMRLSEIATARSRSLPTKSGMLVGIWNLPPIGLLQHPQPISEVGGSSTRRNLAHSDAVIGYSHLMRRDAADMLKVHCIQTYLHAINSIDNTRPGLLDSLPDQCVFCVRKHGRRLQGHATFGNSDSALQIPTNKIGNVG